MQLFEWCCSLRVQRAIITAASQQIFIAMNVVAALCHRFPEAALVARRFLDKSGTFERTYINAEIRLAAGSSEGSVKL